MFTKRKLEVVDYEVTKEILTHLANYKHQNILRVTSLEIPPLLLDITDGQKPLQLAIGIASSLLSQHLFLKHDTEKLSFELSSKQLEINELLSQVRFLRKELMKRAVELDEKDFMLRKTKEQLETVFSEKTHLVRTINRSKTLIPTEAEEYRASIAGLQTTCGTYRERISRFANLIETEKQKKREFKLKNQNLSKGNRQLEEHKKFLHQRINSLAFTVKKVEMKNSELENSKEVLVLIIQTLKTKISQLKSEKSLQVPTDKMETSDGETETCFQSLHSELGDLSATSNITSFLLTVAAQDRICVLSTGSRLSPETEYFRLSVQSVKLNSVYFEQLTTIDSEALYRRACSQKIPFHRWYPWIEAQLALAFIKKHSGKPLSHNIQICKSLMIRA